jgi:hypothetical protein
MRLLPNHHCSCWTACVQQRSPARYPNCLAMLSSLRIEHRQSPVTSTNRKIRSNVSNKFSLVALKASIWVRTESKILKISSVGAKFVPFFYFGDCSKLSREYFLPMSQLLKCVPFHRHHFVPLYVLSVAFPFRAL